MCDALRDLDIGFQPGDPRVHALLAAARFFVRTGDHRGAYRLPGDAPADPSEIVVPA